MQTECTTKRVSCKEVLTESPHLFLASTPSVPDQHLIVNHQTFQCKPFTPFWLHLEFGLVPRCVSYNNIDEIRNVLHFSVFV